MILPALAGAVTKTQRAVASMTADVPRKTTNQVTTMAALAGRFFQTQSQDPK